MKIITFDVGGTAIKFGMVDENFEVLFSEEFPTNEFEDTDNMVMYAMESKLRQYEGEYDAIGISTAGQVDFENGMIHDGVGNIPNYNHSDLRGTFERIFNVPVAVDNDVNCAAIGEAHFGAAKGAKDFLCLTYGTGVGGCIYINGDVYRGSKFAGGEFGHMATHKDGRPCTCGRIGCYEAYAACRVFTKAVSDRMGRKMTGREIFEEENLKLLKEQIHNLWKNDLNDYKKQMEEWKNYKTRSLDVSTKARKNVARQRASGVSSILENWLNKIDREYQEKLINLQSICDTADILISPILSGIIEVAHEDNEVINAKV